MIHTPLTEVLKDAGFAPENFYIHPVAAHGCTYIPVWHMTTAKWRAEREQRDRVTEKNEHRIDRTLT